MYLRQRTWIETGPRLPARARRRGLGETAVYTSHDPVPLISEVPPDVQAPPVPLPPFYMPPALLPPAGSLPCVSGAGPLQPGQEYCLQVDPGIAMPGAPAAVASLWDSVKPYAAPVGIAAAVLFGLSMLGGRRR